MLKQIPNFLTITRIFLVLPFLLCLMHQEFLHAFYIFIIAGFTDGLDGRLARSFAWQSHLGAIIDPLADKILITVSFIALAYLDLAVGSRHCSSASGCLCRYMCMIVYLLVGTSYLHSSSMNLGRDDIRGLSAGLYVSY